MIADIPKLVKVGLDLYVDPSLVKTVKKEYGGDGTLVVFTDETSVISNRSPDVVAHAINKAMEY